MNEAERAIAKRVRLVRFYNQLSVPQFAKAVGAGQNQIAGVEYARTPLTVVIADKISMAFDVNLIWLAHGKGRMKPSVGPISGILPHIKGSALLSQSVTGEFEAKAKANYEHGMTAMSSILVGDSGITTEDTAAGYAEYVRGYFDELFSDLPVSGKAKLLALLTRTLAKFGTDWELGNRKNPGENITMRPGGVKTERKDMLDNAKLYPHTDGVKDEIRNLKDLVDILKKVTARRGAKASLAREFGVTRQAVNQWLSGESAPSADAAIRLLRWVSQPGHQK